MFQKTKELLLKLLKTHTSPTEIALGIAIGVFICTLPLYGLHTLLMLLAAILVRRANKVAIFIGTNFSLPPTVPFITLAGYEIGRRILGPQYPALNWAYFQTITFAKIKSFYFPLFVGSAILGLIAAIFFYLLTLGVIMFWRRRHHHEA